MAYVPRVAISVPPNRDYQMTLTQTKMVYDNLLADKHGKLFAVSIYVILYGHSSRINIVISHQDFYHKIIVLIAPLIGCICERDW